MIRKAILTAAVLAAATTVPAFAMTATSSDGTVSLELSDEIGWNEAEAEGALMAYKADGFEVMVERFENGRQLPLPLVAKAGQSAFQIVSSDENDVYVVSGVSKDVDGADEIRKTVESFSLVGAEVETEVESESEKTVAEDGKDWTVSDVDCEKYVTSDLNVRKEPNKDAEKIGLLNRREKVRVTGEIALKDGTKSEWVRIERPDGEAFVHGGYLSDEDPGEAAPAPVQTYWAPEEPAPSSGGSSKSEPAIVDDLSGSDHVIFYGNGNALVTNENKNGTLSSDSGTTYKDGGDDVWNGSDDSTMYENYVD